MSKISINRTKFHRSLRYGSYILLFIIFVLLIPGPKAAYGGNAKYIILMISDGWGPKHIEATNKYCESSELCPAPLYQSDPQWAKHWISTFPDSGSYDTALAWSDFNYVTGGSVADSASAATALYSGFKTQNGRISVSSDGAASFLVIGEIAKANGFVKSVGAVSSVPVSHATPGAWIAHNDNRVNTYAIADEGLFEDPNTTGTILDDSRYGGGHGPTVPPVDVLIGGGNSAYVNTPIRDKLRNESGLPGKHFLIEKQTGQDGGDSLLAAANNPAVTKLAGLFEQTYHNADGSGFNPENPTLAESTIAALTVLNKNPNGFVLMIEGGAVDWAAHANNMSQMVGEQIDFDDAVQEVIDWVNSPGNGSNWNNTLVIVTGDHETGYLTPGPGIFPDQMLGEVSDRTLLLEEIVLGSSGRRASWEDDNSNQQIDPLEVIYWYWNSGNHSNTLIPLYTRGADASLFAGYETNGPDTVRGSYIDNTDIFSVMNSALEACVETGSISIVSGQTLRGTSIDITSIVTANNAVNLFHTVIEGSSFCTVDPDGTYINAENFSAIIPTTTGTGTFTFESSQGGHLGSGYLKSNGGGIGDCSAPKHEGKEYQVYFPSAGTYTFWIRAFADGSASDSMFIGFDNTCIGSLDENLLHNQWVWSNNVKAGSNIFTVPSAGLHTINIWTREPSHLVDGIYITQGQETPDDFSHGIEINPNNCSGVLFAGDETAAQSVDTTNWINGIKNLQLNGDDAICLSALPAANGSFNFNSNQLPSSFIQTPLNGAFINNSTSDPYIVSGTAADDVEVSGIEVSGDGGSTWNPAVCTGCPGASVSWTYAWTLPANDSYTIQSRATDSSGEVEVPAAGNAVSVDRTAPSVINTIPASGTTGVAADSPVSVIWDEDIDCLTVDETSVTITPPAGWTKTSCSINQAVFTPGGQTESTIYTITISTATSDIADNPMDAEYQFTHTTIDNVIPQSSISDPADGTVISSSATDPYIISGTAADNLLVSNIEISLDGGNTWSSTVCTGCPGAGVSWTYDWTLPDNGNFIIQSRAADSSGNIETPSSGSTITVDRTVPSVSSSNPGAGAAGVSVDSAVTINWDEEVDCSTVDITSVTITPPVGWTRSSCSASQAVFTPAGQTGITGYSITVNSSVADTAGNAMTSNHQFSYTTAIAGAPVSVITIPLNGSVFNSSTPDPYLITGTATDNIDVTGVEVSTDSGNTWSPALCTECPAPFANWQFSWDLTLDGAYTIQTRASDSTGNVEAPSTGNTVILDRTGPLVSSTVPGNGAPGISIDSAVTINWDEEVNCSTIDETSVTITPPAGWTKASCSASQAVFSPVGQADSTIYTVNVSTSVSDTAGNPQSVNHEFSYTTNFPPDISISQPDISNPVIKAGDLYSIIYSLNDPDDIVSASLSYDTDNLGFNGTPITNCIAASEGTDAVCTWNTSGMTPDAYYIYGVTDDGSGAIQAYSPGQLIIGPPNISPALTISDPDGVDDTIVSGDTFTITYMLDDPDDTVFADFYYDTDNADYDGTLIGGCASAGEGTGITCTWSSSGIPAGTYYVYGITDDGYGQVRSYSPGSVTINLANTLPTLSINEPDGFRDKINEGGLLSISYTLGDPDDIVTVALFYDNDNSGFDGTSISACASEAEGNDEVCIWDTTGVVPGSYYIYGTTTDRSGVVNTYSSGQATVIDPPVLGITGDQYTINGQPAFLLGASYYDGRHWSESDLISLAEKGFNLIRVWTDWAPNADFNGIPWTDYDSYFDNQGNLAHEEDLIDLVRTAGKLGMVLDVTLLHSHSFGGDFSLKAKAVRSIVKALINEPNAFFCVMNEHNVFGGPSSFPILHSEAALLISAGKSENPDAIIAVSGGRDHYWVGGQESLILDETNVSEEVQISNVSFLGPHFTRGINWASKTAERVTITKDFLASIGAPIPVYLGENHRRRWYLFGSVPDPPAPDFLESAKGAFNADAAGYVFHTDAGFDMRLFDFFARLDSEELYVVDNLEEAIFQGNTLTASGNTSIASVNPADGDSGIIMQRFQVNTDSSADGHIELNSLDIIDNGAASNILNVQIYISSTSTTSLPADAVLIGNSGQWDGLLTTIILNAGSSADSTVTFGIASYIYIVYDLAFGQTGNTIQSSVIRVTAALPDVGAGNIGSSNTLTTGACLETGSIAITSGQTLNGNPVDVTSIVTANNATNLSYSVSEQGSFCSIDPVGTYINAENFSDTIPTTTGTGTFTFESSQAGHLGAGYLKNNGGGLGDCSAARHEGKEYQVNFPSAGTYTFWIRSYAENSASDSIFIGFNNSCIGALDGNLINNQWTWSSNIKNGSNTFTVPSAGLHTINIWPREPNHLVDGIYITQGQETPDDFSHGIEINPTSCSGVLFTGDETSSQTIDTAGWSDGPKNIQVTGSDALCLTALPAADGSFVFDSNQLPISSIEDPLNGAFINNSASDPYIISGIATDDGEVSSIEISSDGGTIWNPAVCTGCPGASVSWIYDWTLPVNGIYTIQSRATDSSGKIEAPAAGSMITVDRTAPAVNSTIPINGATEVIADSPVSINWDEDIDCSTVDAASVTITPLTGWTRTSCSAGQAVFTPDGQTGTIAYTVTVTTSVTDTAGNLMAANHQFSYTTSLVEIPASTITDPLDQAIFNSNSDDPYIITGTATDNIEVSGVEVSTDGGNTWSPALCTLCPAPIVNWQLSWNLPPDGAYNIRTRATDSSGNIETPLTGNTVTIDRTAPAIISSDPTGGSAGASVNSPVTIYWSEDMNCSTIDETSVTIVPPAGFTKTFCNTNQAVFTPSGQTDSTAYTITVNPVTADTAGNQMTANHEFTYTTNIPPTLSLSQPDITNPNVTTGDSFNIIYSLGDSDDDVNAAFFYDTDNTGFDGAAIADCTAASEGTDSACIWDTTATPLGAYYIYGKTDDGSGVIETYSPGQVVINACVETGSISITPGQTFNGNPVDLNSIVTANSASNLFLTVSEGSSFCTVDPDGTYINAEDFSDTIPTTTGTGTFTFESSQAGHLGSGYLKSNGGGIGDCSAPKHEGKEYQVYFPSAGTYTFWIRAFADGSASDSIFIGFDNNCIGSLDENLLHNQWVWSSNIKAGSNIFTVPSAGLHTINVWTREPNHLVDGIYITQGPETPDDFSHGIEIDPNNCSGVLFAGDETAAQSVDTTSWVSGPKDLQVTGDDITCGTSLPPANEQFSFVP